MTFYFAWVDPSTAFSAGTHSVVDEDVYAFEVSHSEGDFPMLSIDIRNPRTNLIDPSRKLWAWLSQDGTPIFYGRLVAIPEDIHLEIVRLNFIARPTGFDTTKRALAETLKVAPFWDPLWINEQRLDDPDVVLEARPQLWHIDRITHAVTISSITSGEDGIGEFTHFYDSLKISYGAAPLRRVAVNASVSWNQVGEGTVNITPELLNAFAAAGSPAGLVSSYTGQGLEADWPQAFKNIGGGWRTGNIQLVRQNSSRSKIVRINNTNPNPSDLPGAFLEPPLFAEFFVWEFRPQFPVEYTTSRKRVENILFTVEADVQPLVVEAGEDEVELITLSARGDSTGSSGSMLSVDPIVEPKTPSFVRTIRGIGAFEYLLMLARAKLLARARAVSIEFSVPFSAGLSLSCRQSAHVVDPRLPNGDARGKVIEYRLIADGNGVQRCDITIGATIGEGNTITGVAGTPTYGSTDYMGIDYQRFIGAEFNVAGDINYDDFRDLVIDDDGLDLLTGLQAPQVVTAMEVTNGEREQEHVLSIRYQDIPASIEALNAKATKVRLRLKPIGGGPFNTTVNVNVSNLMIPKTMEL